MSILRIYTFSCLLFFVFSVFNIYEFKVYDTWSLVVFYIYEGILWLGMKVGGARFHIRPVPKSNIQESTNRAPFIISRQGQIIVSFIFIASLLSFVYFLVLFLSSFSVASFGSSIKGQYDAVARTELEVITVFVMQAGSAAYLIIMGSKDSVSRILLIMARICLFLPGLRGAFLGRRFTLAVEALIFFFAEYGSISNTFRSMKPKKKKTIKQILIVSIVVVVLMLYIFSRRIVYFPDSLFVAHDGDMVLKPFWDWVYSQVGDQMNVFAYVSFYAGHAPYAFSYSHANVFSDFPKYWCLETCRVFIQITTNMFGLSPSYAEMARQVPGIARYTGYAGTLINDFGVYLAPFIAFLFGVIFSRIERSRNKSPICHGLYPIVQVACLFVPTCFFSVGGVDQVAFWAVILSPFCLRRYAGTD